MGLIGAQIAVSGCTTSSGPGAAVTSVPSVSATPTVAPGGYIALPLDAYALVGTNAATVIQALGLLEQQCMVRLGFTSWTPPPASSSPAATTTLTDFPFRPANATDAATFGYRKPGGVIVPVPIAGKPSDAEFQALYGIVPGKGTAPSDPHGGGCSRTAFDKLNQGRPSFDENLYGQLQQNATDRTQADSRVRAGYAAWSSCMQRSGFTYTTPVDAANRAWTGKRPSSLEIATASADVQCRISTNLLGIWIAVLSAYERQLISVNATKLATLAAATAYEVQHAAAVVANS